MPRRNLLILILAVVAALFCQQRVQKNPYGKVLVGAMTRIEDRYLEPVDASTLFQNAMNGMVASLDEHSAYITPEQVKGFDEEMDFVFGGVGLQVALDPQTKQLKVSVPLFRSPAFKAGVRAGDVILKIADASTQGMSLQDALTLLRGKPGEPVTLTVLHQAGKNPVEISVVRETISIDSVLGDARNPDGSWYFFLEGYDRVGYVRIITFTDKTAEDFKKAVEWLSARDMRGMVLDLRDNPGGYLDDAVDVCNLLIDSGVIVSVRRRGGHTAETYTAGGNTHFTDFPLAVLVNQETASAAEIVAACLQDHNRAVVVGQRTFGKGTVQELVDLERNCGKLKLTTASYWRPNGKNINRSHDTDEKTDWGVSPNDAFAVSIDIDEQNRWRLWLARRDALLTQPDAEKPFLDRQLRRAVDYILKKSEP